MINQHLERDLRRLKAVLVLLAVLNTLVVLANLTGLVHRSIPSLGTTAPVDEFPTCQLGEPYTLTVMRITPAIKEMCRRESDCMDLLPMGVDHE